MLEENRIRELVQRAGSGDMEAFGLLYQEYGTRVYQLCLRMLKNTTEAEDLAQEVWMKLMGRIASFKGDSLFSTWLHRVTVNEVLMHMRVRDTRRNVNISFGEAPVEGMPLPYMSYNPDPVTRIALDRAIGALPAGYKIVFGLKVMGYEHREIADVLEINEGTSKSQFSKARRNLGKVLGHIES